MGIHSAPERSENLPVPLATLFNGEPGGHAAGGRSVVKTISDYLNVRRPVQTNVARQIATLLQAGSYNSARHLGLHHATRTLSEPSTLRGAKSSDGADHRGAASKPGVRSPPALARWPDGQGCPFRDSHELDPVDSSSRNPHWVKIFMRHSRNTSIIRQAARDNALGSGGCAAQHFRPGTAERSLSLDGSSPRESDR
jgi:hypothetical protein